MKSDTVFIYQMGKVGSTTIEGSVSGSVNVHDFYGNYVCPPRAALLGFGLKEKIGRYVLRIAISLRRNIKIITIDRDDAERNVSMYLQDFPFWYVYGIKHGVIRNKDEGEDVIERVFDQCFDHNYPANWRKNEFERLTEVDLNLYRSLENYIVINKKRFNILYIKMSFLNSSEINSILTDFCGKKITLVDHNRGGKKWYSNIYESHKDALLEIARKKER